MSVKVFFFSFSGHHRDLHSFPTRRSSDLTPSHIGTALREQLLGGRLWRDIGVSAEAFVVGDRKSTRLNSSHANISYAVFCLKKKNSNQNTSSRMTIGIIKLARIGSQCSA